MLAPERITDLADRRDTPEVGHANVGPDDRSSLEVDDIEEARAERVPAVDASVIERDAAGVDRP